MTISPNVLSDGVLNVVKVGENSVWGAGCICDVLRVYDVEFCGGALIAVGEPPENGEWRFKRRSASETNTGSGAGMLLKARFGGGGGIDAELNCAKADGAGSDCDSNFIWGSDITDAIEPCVLDGGCFGGAGFVLRLSPFSDVYMTATLVDGEFIVPVRDHPIA